MPGLEQPVSRKEYRPSPLKKAGTFLTDSVKTLKAKVVHEIEGNYGEVDYDLAMAIINRSAGRYSKTSWKQLDKKQQAKEIDRIARTIHLLRQGLEHPNKSVETIDCLGQLAKFADEISDIQRARLPAKEFNRLIAMAISTIKQELIQADVEKSTEMQEMLINILASSLTSTKIKKELKSAVQNSIPQLPLFDSNHWHQLGWKEALIFECGNDEDRGKLTEELLGQLAGTPAEIERAGRLMAQLYLSPLNKAREESQRILGILLAKHGLEPEKIIKAWDQSGAKQNTKERPMLRTKFIIGFGKNIEHLYLLEARRPGAAKFLWKEYQLADFGRYPIELLEQQYDSHEKNDLPYGIIIFPQKDWNGALYSDVEVFRKFLKELEGRFYLRAVECEGKIGIARQLLKLDKRYGQGHKIQFAYIGGHANGTEMEFGEGRMNELTVEDLKGAGIRRASAFFTPDATIMLSACKVGLPGGIGPVMSKELGLEVIGPDGISSTEAIHANFSTRTPSFTVEYSFKGGEGYIKNYIEGIEKADD